MDKVELSAEEDRTRQELSKLLYANCLVLIYYYTVIAGEINSFHYFKR